MSGILEIARVVVKSGCGDAFEEAVTQLRPLFLKAAGNKGFSVRRSVENERAYVFLVAWEKVEDHTVGFMGSPDFLIFIEAVGGFFDAEPFIEHTTLAVG
ncbi:antibiotic biosynthesis monooxygenase family protein [Brucella oryzae]|uniref:antibiotic biosynthesis monooxygenase family protein n=1 Tax=Brucella oryzae TaxID=335286 RepID=UPI0035BC831D